MTGRVVNIHHKAQFDIYIGRAGKGRAGPLGNPIPVGKPCIMCGAQHGRNQALLDCYRRWLWSRMQEDPEYRALVRGCHGKTLGCFCVRSDGSGPCHGQVLLRAAAFLVREDLE